MKQTKRSLWIIGVLAIVLLFGAYLRTTAVPVRQFGDTSWFFHEKQRPTVVRVPRDQQIDRAISHAQKDYFIAPAIDGRRWINFGAAFTVEPNDLYLVFDGGETHVLIIYRCSRENGTLFWKARELQSF